MRSILVLDGVSLPHATGRPVVSLTPADKAIAHIPGWQMLVDPDYIVSGKARNLALPNNITGHYGSNFTTGTFANGERAFDLSEDRRILPNIAFPTEAWTFFAVAKPSTSDIGQRYVSAVNESSSPSVIEPSLGLTAGAGGVRTWSRGISDARASVSMSLADQEVYIMWTGSTRDGLRIYINGVELDHNASATEPFNKNSGPGEWRCLYGVRGLVGMMGLLSIDLGWTENTGYRRALDRFLMSKYGIA